MKKHIAVFVSILLIMPVFAFAQTPPVSALGQVDSGNPGNIGVMPSGATTAYTSDNLVTSLIGLLNWFSWFIGLAAVVMGLYSGWLFITARDDAKQLESARKTMLYAIIGIAVAIVAGGLIAITQSLLAL